jgi:DNA gyrase subunit B
MYVGRTDGLGVLRMVDELLRMPLRFADEERCTRIDVALDGEAIRIDTDGPGFPMGIEPRTRLPFLAAYFTSVRPLDHLVRFQDWTRRESSSFHLRADWINALASSLSVESHGDERAHRAQFTRGRLRSEIEDLGPSEQSGTSLELVPDPGIFKARLERGAIEKRLRELAAFHPRARITLDGESIAGDVASLLPASRQVDPLVVAVEQTDLSVLVAVTWIEGAESKIVAFGNDDEVTDGKHVRAVQAGLKRLDRGAHVLVVARGALAFLGCRRTCIAHPLLEKTTFRAIRKALARFLADGGPEAARGLFARIRSG